MPITQSRMLDLISAADDILLQLEQVNAAAALYQARVATGEISPYDALTRIISMTDPTAVVPMARAAILIEKRHFKSNQGRNASAARRQARKRDEARGGLPAAPRPTAPNRETRYGAKTAAIITSPEPQWGDDAPIISPGVQAELSGEALANEIAAMELPIDFAAPPSPEQPTSLITSEDAAAILAMGKAAGTEIEAQRALAETIAEIDRKIAEGKTEQ